jgi:hypothetical protein
MFNILVGLSLSYACIYFCLCLNNCALFFLCLRFFCRHSFSGLNFSVFHYFWFFFLKFSLKPYSPLWNFYSYSLDEHIPFFKADCLSFCRNSQRLFYFNLRHNYFNFEFCLRISIIKVPLFGLHFLLNHFYNSHRFRLSCFFFYCLNFDFCNWNRLLDPLNNLIFTSFEHFCNYFFNFLKLCS